MDYLSLMDRYHRFIRYRSLFLLGWILIAALTIYALYLFWIGKEHTLGIIATSTILLISANLLIHDFFLSGEKPIILSNASKLLQESEQSINEHQVDNLKAIVEMLS